MRAEAFGQCGHDAGAFPPVAFVREVVVTAGAEAADLAIGTDRQHVGHLVDQPFRRRGRRRAEHGPQAGRMQRVDRPLEPVELQVAPARFEPGPREFADTDEGDPGFGHAAGVLRPYFLRPVLRVVADAKRTRCHGKHLVLVLRVAFGARGAP